MMQSKSGAVAPQSKTQCAKNALGRTATFWSAEVLCRFRLHAAPEKQSIQQQQDHGTDDRHDPASDVILSHKKATDPRADKRARDAEQNRDDATAGILARHQQFRDCANDKTNKNNPNN